MICADCCFIAHSVVTLHWGFGLQILVCGGESNPEITIIACTLSWSVFKSCGQSQLLKYQEFGCSKFRSQPTESQSAFPTGFPQALVETELILTRFLNLD